MSKNTEINTMDNYYQILGLPVSFDIDNERLNSNYHEIQKSVHPDNFANSSDLERRLSVQKAGQINDALETLKNPLRRSIYLLSLYGVELTDNDTSIDPEFLMEQMDLRENLSEVNSKDNPLDKLDEILDDVKLRIKRVTVGLGHLFQELLSESIQQPETQKVQQEQLLADAKVQVLKMQFLNRLQEECLNKEEELVNQL